MSVVINIFIIYLLTLVGRNFRLMHLIFKGTETVIKWFHKIVVVGPEIN